MEDAGPREHRLQQALRALSSLNLNALRVLLGKGARPALEYARYTYRLYTGFGLPSIWNNPPWRSPLKIPSVPVAEVFPEIDFTHSPELLHPFPRSLGVAPHELMVLAHVVRHFRPQRVVEFGTAEGRTTLNIALHLPPEGEVVTIDFPPIPGKNDVGYFYWDQPARSKIKQVFSGVESWGSSPYRASADVVFCDACDQPAGLAAETAQAFTVVKPGGIIFRHDYGTAEGPTLFWNELSKEFPVRHLEGTALLCLRIDSNEIYDKTQAMLAAPPLAASLGTRASRKA
jgi:hypothetical protein